MAYIGRIPQVGNYFTLDAITTSATDTFNLLKGGVAYVPESAYHIFVSLNGVIQAPITAYTVSGSTIVFDSALASTYVIDFITVLGDTLAIGTPSDATVTDAKIVDVAATKLTGSIADARVPASAVTQHVTGYDDSAIRADISALALREATNEASAAFNLPNSFIDTFTDDTNLGTQTTVDRLSGYIASVYSSTPSSVIKFANLGGIYVDESNLLPSSHTNYTQEAWGYLSSGYDSHENHLFSNAQDPYGIVWGANGDTTNVRRGLGNGSWQSIGNFAVTIAHSNWYHWAFVKTASGVSFYFNGTRVEHNNPASFSYNDNKVWLGRGVSASSHNWEGYATEWRISSVARYSTATITPSTTEFVSDSDTELLVHSNTSNGTKSWTDSSSNGYTVTPQNSNPEHSTDVASPLTSSVANATGTLIQSANVVGSAKTEVSGTFLYKDNAGTATLGTDLKIYFTCNGGSNWTEAASYNAITPVYSSGIKQVRLGKTTCTSGTDVRYKAVWANQASGSKETQLHGIGINY